MGRLWFVHLVVCCGLLVACGPKQAPQKVEELSPETQIRLARSMLGAGRVDAALAALDEAIAEYPGNRVLYHNRGLICLEAGRLEESLLAFNEVLRIDSSFTDAHNFLGVVNKELDRPMQAEEHFQAALRDPVYPTPEKVYLNLGLLYRSQGRDTEALSNFRRAVEIDPKYYKGHFELASTLDRLGKLKEAAREYEVAAPGYRQNGNYFFQLGLTYFRLGDKQRAGENLRRVISVAPGSENSARADELLEMLN